MFGLECTYMVKVSYEQKPYRRMMMNVEAKRSTTVRM
jgi:predicted alternative tryptophan synthase beta-subunit